MINPQPVTVERVRSAFELIGQDFEAAHTALGEMYAPDVVFQDPIQKLYGREAFLALNRRLHRRARRIQIRVTSAAQVGDELFLVWVLQYGPRLGPTVKIDGASHLRLAGGLVLEHRDYWDLLGSAMDAVPGLSFLYRALLASLG